MSIDTSVTSGASQTLIVLVWNMLASLGITVSLSQSEVDDVDDVLLLAMTDQKVIRFHVSVDEMVVVQEFESLNHLVGNHQSGFDREFALAEVESVLQTGSQ